PPPKAPRYRPTSMTASTFGEEEPNALTKASRVTVSHVLSAAELIGRLARSCLPFSTWMRRSSMPCTRATNGPAAGLSGLRALLRIADLFHCSNRLASGPSKAPTSCMIHGRHAVQSTGFSVLKLAKLVELSEGALTTHAPEEPLPLGLKPDGSPPARRA